MLFFFGLIHSLCRSEACVFFGVLCSFFGQGKDSANQPADDLMLFFLWPGLDTAEAAKERGFFGSLAASGWKETRWKKKTDELTG